jgi:hypothetical protein
MIVIFLHIPKCAGMSTKFALRNYYGKKKSISYKELYEKDLSLIHLIDGHLYYGIHRQMNQKFTYITFLRDPIKRCVSLWNQINKTENAKSEYIQKKQMDLHGFVADASQHAIGFYNNQSKRIAGIPEETSCLEYNDENTYQQALKNIDQHFSFIGLTERLDEGLVLLKNILTLDKDLVYVRQNTTQKKQELLTVNQLSQETFDLLRETNKQDLRLYDSVKKRYTEQLAGVSNFDQQLEVFQKKNQRVQHFRTPYIRGRRTILMTLSQVKKTLFGK